MEFQPLFYGSYCPAGTPAIAPDGTVYAGFTNNRLYALDGDSGRRKWTFKTDGLFEREALGENILYHNDIVYISACDKNYSGTSISSGVVYAIDSITGEKIWKYRSAHNDWFAPNIRMGPDGIIYMSHDKHLTAIDGKTGNEKWSIECPEIYSRWPPHISEDGYVYLRGRRCTLHAFDSATGEEVWRYTPDGIPQPGSGPDAEAVIVSPDMAAGSNFIFLGITARDQHSFHVIDRESGKRFGKLDANSSPEATAISKDNANIYLTKRKDGKFSISCMKSNADTYLEALKESHQNERDTPSKTVITVDADSLNIDGIKLPVRLLNKGSYRCRKSEREK